MQKTSKILQLSREGILLGGLQKIQHYKCRNSVGFIFYNHDKDEFCHYSQLKQGKDEWIDMGIVVLVVKECNFIVLEECHFKGGL